MIKSYDSNRKVYCLFDKKTYTKQQALDMAKKNLKVKGSLLEVTCAKYDKTVDGEDVYSVELKSGNMWCVTKCGK